MVLFIPNCGVFTGSAIWIMKIYFYTLQFFLLSIVVSNCRILGSRKLQLSCLTKIAEGTYWSKLPFSNYMLDTEPVLLLTKSFKCSWLSGPLTKSRFFSSEAIAFFKSFLDMYSNIPFPSRETVPLMLKLRQTVGWLWFVSWFRPGRFAHRSLQINIFT